MSKLQSKTRSDIGDGERANDSDEVNGEALNILTPMFKLTQTNLRYLRGQNNDSRQYSTPMQWYPTTRQLLSRFRSHNLAFFHN